MAGGRRSHGQGTFWGDLIGPNPTDRGKAGTKRSLLVDGEGGPLSIVVAGANVHDAKLLEATLDAIVVERPQPTEEEPQHLCLDKGYDNPSGRGAAAGHGYREHIRRIGEEKLDASGDKRYPARRWVVERTLAWLSKCRGGPGPVRQEGSELPRCVTARMCAPVVPATVASGHFEIVTKDYNRLVLEMASRLRESGLDKADAVTAGFLKEQTAYAREWPSDEAVADALGSSPLYRLLTRGRLRLVLEGVERRLRLSGKTEQPAVPKNLTIEHLMPVGWDKMEWQLPDGVDTDAATYQRNTLIHSIGNLTLATQKLNSSMSNGPWASKRDELQEHSVLLLNNELLSQPAWDEDTIRCRSRRMAQLVSKRWPGPASDEWNETK